MSLADRAGVHRPTRPSEQPGPRRGGETGRAGPLEKRDGAGGLSVVVEAHEGVAGERPDLVSVDLGRDPASRSIVRANRASPHLAWRAELPVQRRSAFEIDDWNSTVVVVDGVDLLVHRTGGNKPPAALIHGITDCGLCWSRLARDLAGQYDVVRSMPAGHRWPPRPWPARQPDVVRGGPGAVGPREADRHPEVPTWLYSEHDLNR